jgi:hypothetical protein
MTIGLGRTSTPCISTAMKWLAIPALVLSSLRGIALAQCNFTMTAPADGAQISGPIIAVTVTRSGSPPLQDLLSYSLDGAQVFRTGVLSTTLAIPACNGSHIVDVAQLDGRGTQICSQSASVMVSGSGIPCSSPAPTVTQTPTPTVTPTPTPTQTPTPSPTPTPTATPTSTPTPTPSPTPSGLQPLGAAAPSGQSWSVTFDDEFSNDSSIDTSKWNGGAGAPNGGFPFCHTSSYNCNLYPNQHDCLGYAGNYGNECSQNFGGTNSGGFGTARYGEWIDATTHALIIQGYPGNDCTNAPNAGCSYTNSIWAGLQNYGIMSQIYGFFEWNAREPDSTNGQADGYHTDLWCTVNSRVDVTFNISDHQFDAAEGIMGFGNASGPTFNFFDNGNSLSSVIYLTSGQTAASGFHTYGLYWRNDGMGTWGSIQPYFDGQPMAGPYALNGPQWANGVYCFAGWSQPNIYVAGELSGSSGVDSHTSATAPLYIKYFRAWQAQ